MPKYLKRILCFLFCILLCTQVFATGEESLKGVIDKFLIDQGLDASNFSMSYYNPVSGESYSFNADGFFPVDRLRFLPTHMYFYEEEIKGTFEPETPEDPPYTIGGMSLEDCRYHSIIKGETMISEKMQAEIGTAMQYLELINQRYGQLNPNDLPTEYWNGRTLNAAFLMNCIRMVSSRPELYTGLMANYAMVQEDNAFADGSVSYPIVQIRDEAEDRVTAVAEVSAPQNFLIVASVKGAARGDAVLGKLNTEICNYILRQVGEAPIENTPKETSKYNNSSYYIGEERLEKDDTLRHWLILAFAIFAVLAAVAIIIHRIRRNRHRHY